ncbi:flagellar motor switch protein FliM [Candidatus Koribacter versatilis Ellin345]|uniref:Flagellar motor switch protein FliM n=1 Tax=Koribacter versatilis (strain Ellin345) TaxID=204669 RepID=Q1IR62_KORVE|nr:FliM/FliN family flagellar motor switch protein [Candidatus Koribacter versatilis]ABF40638.1 flagellar motor switch protein FliM [Candidatus Koribacter versatilis Ellin345]
MDKLLNQEEIDAIFRAVRTGENAGSGSEGERGRKVEPWNYRQAGQINREQVRSISSLHEGFARNLTHSLGAYLRVPFEANLVSVEQLTYRELLGRLPEVAYYSTFRIGTADNIGAMEMDLSLAFPMIDILLGGQGGHDEQVREITEIEEQILEVVAKVVCKELETAWQPLGMEFAFEARQQAAQLQRLMPPTEKILALCFELEMPGCRGSLNLAFSAVVSNALLRKLSKDWGYRRQSRESDGDGKLHRKLLGCPFPVSLGLVDASVRVRELLQLRAGDILPLKRSAESAIELSVGGRASFRARPVRSGNWRAAQILGRISTAKGVEYQR